MPSGLMYEWWEITKFLTRIYYRWTLHEETRVIEESVASIKPAISLSSRPTLKLLSVS
ncbi:MAG: hypothetical protein P0116_15875 [Candidatus Nitrosocosmicus sp.]|nr:hypothetical protein [Candidatus Nitrosocosmicus sp.]MDF0682435.1 hypothetical protein [Candidatus Nitrosocosmicus sp.]